MDQYKKNYEAITTVLKKLGYEVKADHILEARLNIRQTEDDEHKIDYYKYFLKNVNQADIVVAEASFPSTVHIGHEISIALEKGKAVVVLYVKGKEPIFLKGIASDKLLLVEYTLESLDEDLKYAIKDAIDQIDVRFNFFIPPQIGVYLDWICKHKKLPRSVFLRNLIEEHMAKNKEYRA